MIIFNDIFTGKTILTDSYKMALLEDFLYVVDAKYVTKKGDEFGDELFGGNPSAEEEAEQLEGGGVVRGFDVIINHDEVEEWSEELPPCKKFVKNVMAKLVSEAKKKMDPERHAVFKKNCGEFFKVPKKDEPASERFKDIPIYDKFSNFQIYFSKESIDLETGNLLACPIFVDADDTGMNAKVYYFKDLMVEEKM